MTVLDTVHSPATDSSGSTSRATLALTRFEMWRLVRHPVMAGVLVLYVAYLAYCLVTEGRYPVLQDLDRQTQIPLLLVGIAALLATNTMALSPYRHGATAVFDVLPLQQWRRTLALLSAPVMIAVLSALFVGVQIVAVAAQPDAAGRVSPAELATGPVVVLLLAVAGASLARLTRSVLAAPLVVVGLLAVAYVSVPLKASATMWLQPVIIQEGVVSLPSSTIGRPAAWHLLYLAGVTVLFAAVAVLRSGRRGAAVMVVALVAVLATGAGAVAQSQAPSASITAARRIATEQPAATQVCARRGLITYCAFPDFAKWVADWDQTVRGVRALVPARLATQRLVVRQRVLATAGFDASGITPQAPVGTWAADDRRAGTPGSIPVGTRLKSDIDRLDLAMTVAYRIVTGSAPHPATAALCSSRGIVIFWLAVNATPQSRAGLKEAESINIGGGSPMIDNLNESLDAGSVTLRDSDYGIVKAMLARPRADVDQRIRASWSELTAPRTTTKRAAAILGVTAPKPAADEADWACE